MFVNQRWSFLAKLWYFSVLFCRVTTASITVEEKIREDGDLSQFYSMLERNTLANVSLGYKQLTIFAPTNEAFQRYEKRDNTDQNIVLYHLTNLAKTTNQIESGSFSSLNTELDGNPPLWVTQRVGKFHNDIYVNNAKILLEQSNFKGLQKNNKEQVLHKIDEVLVPVMSSPTVTPAIYNPNAWEFLDKFESLDITSFRIRIFREDIKNNNKEDMFRMEGGNTFLIPTDEGFKDTRPDPVDHKVIDGHIIPKHVLFTAPTPKDKPYETLAFSDNIKVSISFFEETYGKTKTMYVKSETFVGDAKHPEGVVIAEILKANIPVKNGVIHLIHKPLMVVDRTVMELLQEKNGNPMIKFFEAIEDSGNSADIFMRSINNSQTITLFAPNNNAWQDANLKNTLRNHNSMRDVLSMHLVVDRRLTTANIKENNKKKIFQESTINKSKKLYFNIVSIGNEEVVSVEGGGVNATVKISNIVAKNGVIHVIDRVLGVPFTTIHNKLVSDPMLNKTYHLGKFNHFNDQLDDPSRKFTYFVPRDKAWEDAQVAFPSDIKKLFMRDLTYHAQHILERHLVVSDITYTMEKIKQLTNDTYKSYGYKKEIELPSQRDVLRLFVEERQDRSTNTTKIATNTTSFIIHWKGERIPVFRPNVECTNGVIHVIDAPFLKEGDIRISGATTLIIMPHLVLLLICKWLLL